MPVRPPLPVISVGAVAVLVGLALGIGLDGSADRPHGGSEAADPSRDGGPDHRQSGGDLPPMDFEGHVRTTSASPSEATTSTPSAVVATPEPSTVEPRRTEEVTSAVGVTPTPGLPTLPPVPGIPTGSLVGTPSFPVPAGVT